jgi:hypothetical protein
MYVDDRLCSGGANLRFFTYPEVRMSFISFDQSYIIIRVVMIAMVNNPKFVMEIYCRINAADQIAGLS